MDSVNKTLYIPLYGKSHVSKKHIIIKDIKAEEIWETAGFSLNGKSKIQVAGIFFGYACGGL